MCAYSGSSGSAGVSFHTFTRGSVSLASCPQVYVIVFWERELDNFELVGMEGGSCVKISLILESPFSTKCGRMHKNGKSHKILINDN